MKVLSIKEPFATLVLIGKKHIETRSWKTSYRGELYIHTSAIKISKDNLNNIKLMPLTRNKKRNFGNIICKCNLVDCIYMTDEYVINMKKNNYQEYICGEYSTGRYAWILKDITSLETPIKAKGQLNIWKYYNEFEIMNLMNDIKYGYLDKMNNKHLALDEYYTDNYILQSPKEVIKNKVGLCWDQVELERYYFKNHIPNIKTYFIVYYGIKKCLTHTFLIFEKNNKFYWFEHFWENLKASINMTA